MTPTAEQPHVYLLSADGAWRWSPPGRVRVLCDLTSPREIVRAATHAVRLQGEWTLSLDGETPIDPHASVCSGQVVHLLSASRRKVSLLPLPPEAMVHMQLEALGAAAAAAWVDAVYLALAGDAKPPPTLLASLAPHPSLLALAEQTLASLASPPPRHPPPPLLLELERAETADQLIARAWAASTPPCPPPSPGRLLLTSTDRRPLHELRTVRCGATLRLELRFDGPVRVLLHRKDEAPDVRVVELEHRYGYPSPLPCAPVAAVCEAVAKTLQLSECDSATKFLSHGGRLLRDFHTLEEAGVPCGGALDLMLTSAQSSGGASYVYPTALYARGDRVKATWHNERMYKGRVFTVRAGFFAVAFDDGDFRDNLTEDMVMLDEDEMVGGSFAKIPLPPENLAYDPLVETSPLRRWNGTSLTLNDGTVISA
ncbi:hypothetical protein AB1Y20_010714 [Prymnesium parvum]|uniref:Ubiquitin-like domain-containing protein n=1 Tax=Prymnesium parvum TaxID=97485 RepID=A0AB34IQG8_PRYPA